MGFFDFLKSPDINQGLKEFEHTPEAVLLDVRNPQEYAEGRVPGSKNLPLPEIGNITSLVPDSSTPLFVYCLSGARSSQAVSSLHKMGYTSVTNMGGINGYKGKVVR